MRGVTEEQWEDRWQIMILLPLSAAALGTGATILSNAQRFQPMIFLGIFEATLTRRNYSFIRFPVPHISVSKFIQPASRFALWVCFYQNLIMKWVVLPVHLRGRISVDEAEDALNKNFHGAIKNYQ